MRRSSQGVTLLEIMLVLAIMAGIMAFGFQQYIVYRKQAEMFRLRTNANILFDALALYVAANCSNAKFNDPAQTIQTIKVSDLIKNGFLGQSLPLSPLLDYSNTTNPDDAYVVQFNQMRVGENQRDLPTRDVTTQYEPNMTQAVGKIIIWKIQVAAPLLDAENATTTQQLLNANCVSSAGPDDTVNPCSENTEGNYVVWERLPSMPISYNLSANSAILPLVRQYRQTYYTYPILLLTEGPTFSNRQYFVCNG